MATAALSVLSNAQLFGGIVAWADGWPGLVAQRWREIKAARTDGQLRAFERKLVGARDPRTLEMLYFMWELVWRRDRRTLELTKRVSSQFFLIDNIRLAIAAGDAEAVGLAHGVSKAADEYERRQYWALAVDQFPGHVSVLEGLYTLERPNEMDLRLSVQYFNRRSVNSGVSVMPSLWARSVINVDSVVLAEWLIAKLGAGCLPPTLLHIVALRGNLPLVRVLNTVEGQEIDPHTFQSVYRLLQHHNDEASSYLAVLDFLLRRHHDVNTLDLEELCLEAGDHETLALILRTRGRLSVPDVDIDMAASRGFLKAIQLVAVNSSVMCTSHAMDGAAANGYHDVVQFLHENRHEGCTTRAMDVAAARGFLDVVRYLHTHRREGCTTEALDQAVQQGHLEVVQFLHENRTEGCTAAAFTYPRPTHKSTKEQITKVRSALMYLLEHHTEMHPEDLEFDALRFRDLDVLSAIQRSRGLQFLRNVEVDVLAREGQLALIRFLVEHVSVVCSTAAMDAAAANNHLDVVKYLHETREEGCTTMAMDMAANANHWDVVAFLDKHRHEGCTVVLLNAAVRLGRLDLVQRYCKRALPQHGGAAVVVAGVYGRTDIQDFLRSNSETPRTELTAGAT